MESYPAADNVYNDDEFSDDIFFVKLHMPCFGIMFVSKLVYSQWRLIYVFYLVAQFNFKC